MGSFGQQHFVPRLRIGAAAAKKIAREAKAMVPSALGAARR